MGESSGTTARDTGPNSLSATYTNGPALGKQGALAGDSDTSAHFDGTNDYAVTSANGAINSDSFSVEAWVLPDSLKVQSIVNKGSHDNSWRLFMNNTSGNIEFDAKQDTVNCATIGSDTIPAGQWAHLVGTFNKMTQEAKIYINGSLHKTCTGITDMGGSYNSGIKIGVNADPGYYWTGNIDEVAVYRYALSAEAVKLHYGDHETYSYDNLYRLTNVKYADGVADSYTYDAVGNRLSKNSTTYSYDAGDQLTSVGGVTYTHDNNGNLTGRGSDTFSWDRENRLTSATVGGVSTTFTYDGDGLRRSLTTGGNAINFTWDINRGIPQLIDDGTLKYAYGLGRISQATSGGAPYYYLTDGLGSTVGLTDGSGAVVNTYEYDVFGAIRASTGSQANVFKFTGEQQDASTALEYLRARYLDPTSCRFLSQDRFPASPIEPASTNRYAYALNDPINLVDPSGEHCRPLHPHHCIGDAIDVVRDATYGIRAPITRALEGALLAGSTGDIHYEGGVRIVENCGGALGPLLSLFGAGAFTLGHTICVAGPLDDPILKRHEMNHVKQYDLLGDAFLFYYFGPANLAAILECVVKGDTSGDCFHDSNVLERLAGPDR